jgi:hypothetical protein
VTTLAPGHNEGMILYHVHLGEGVPERTHAAFTSVIILVKEALASPNNIEVLGW